MVESTSASTSSGPVNQNTAKTGSSGMVGVRTVQHIYLLANPRSCEGYAKAFIENYPRENRLSLDVAVTRRAGVVQYVLPENLNESQMASPQVTLDCTLHVFDVIDAEQRELCMNMMEQDFTSEESEKRDRFVIIAGGDGSFPTTVGMLRTRPIIEDAMR